MAAAPNIAHQITSGNLSAYLTIHAQHAGLGRVLSASCDLELPLNDVLVQPDIIVVLNANLSILKGTRIVGTPDLVIEILSPGTAGHDRRKKQDAYARAGVHEHWLADPYSQTIELLRLEADAYQSVGAFSGASTLPSRVVPELPVRIEQFFA